jgi:Domain of unknown function (DUF4326)
MNTRREGETYEQWLERTEDTRTSTTVEKWDNRNEGEGVVYIGRPSRWGNPFRIGQHGSRETVIKLYGIWLHAPEQKALRNRARCELRGKRLACYCSPLPCHGDALAKVADSEIEP